VQFPYHTTVTVSLTVIGGLDAFSAGQGDLDALLAGAADPYATLRSAYLQNRQGEIDEGKAPAALPDLGDQPMTATPQAPPTDPQGAAPEPAPQATGPQASAGAGEALDPDGPIATAAL
jgi:phospholipid-binding lipoprotein MlaA